MHIALVRAKTREGLIAQTEEVLHELQRGTRFMEGEHVLRATGYIHSDWAHRPWCPSQQRPAKTLNDIAAHCGRPE